MNLYMTQVKREIWENKVSFIYTPIIISMLILTMIICTTLYVKDGVSGNDRSFHYTFGSAHVESGTNPPNEAAHPLAVDKKNGYITSSLIKDSTVFNAMVMGGMYINCAMLYLVFSIVMSAYSLRCLFDDRKNKDILFWRSMPVSETTNVLIKLSMVMLGGPLVMLLLNLVVTFIIFILGTLYFAVHGVEFGYLISSVFQGGALYIPLQIFYELLFSLLMLLPVIGFAFFASAYAKKTPFYIFVSPVILVLADKILNSVLGINIGIANLLSVYGRALVKTQDAFLLQHSFHFNQTMIFPLIMCLAIGSAFIAGAIWLRNNRYEI